MKRLIFPLVIAFAWAPVVRASAPLTLTSVRAIRSLSSAEVRNSLSVDFQATVTSFRSDLGYLFVQDGDTGIFVETATSVKLVPGDRVLIKGKTEMGYRPNVVSSDITVLGHGALPKPVRATFGGLIKGQFDSLLVTARGVVHSADRDSRSPNQPPRSSIRILMDGGYVEAQAAGADEQALSELLDAEVEVTGVASGRFDGKMEITGAVLDVADLANIKILKRAAVSPWSLPQTPIDQILGSSHIRDLSGRIRVSGTVTYFDPGSAMVLENGDRSIWVKTSSFAPMRMGDRVEATGFPGLALGFLAVERSEIHDTGIAAPVNPLPVTWRELASSQHIFDLVSIEGTVEMEAREASQNEFVLTSGGHTFSAVLPQSIALGGRNRIGLVPVGARVRVTGICVTNNSNPFDHTLSFSILLRSPADIAVISNPSWFTVRHLIYLVVLLTWIVLMEGARAWSVDRTKRTQVASLAYLVQRRGLILEDINSLKPLAGILERVTELASASLKGAPCWCQIVDGAKLGNCPARPDSSDLRVVERPITPQAGPPLGTIYAAFAARTIPNTEEEKALETAAKLSLLAIETLRLHSDLVRRSEFDMLTGVQNRFAFDKHLDRMIEEARRSAGIFGLIYIDLNEFKHVNDFYGHQVGDIYLQQVADRMRAQVRPGDLLARLGGDEFGVLVQGARSSSEVEEIAQRLERCFDEPFDVQDCCLQGSASIGFALYPAEASTHEDLMSCADAAMYVAKQSRQERERALAAASKS